MKSLFLSISMLLAAVAYSQLPTNENGNVEYRKTLESTLSKEQLKENAIGWISTTFTNVGKNAIQQNDTVKGKITLPQVEVRRKIANEVQNIQFDISIDYKSNKWRYCFTNIHYVLRGIGFENKYLITGGWNNSLETLKKEVANNSKRANKKSSKFITEKEQEISDLNNVFSEFAESLKNKMEYKDDF